MLKKKVRVSVGRVPPKQAKKPPQNDDQAWRLATTAQLNRMEKKLDAIILTLKPSKNITPELETAINRNSALAKGVDRQVPDENRKK